MHACLRHVNERLFSLWYRSHLSTNMIMPIPIILFGFISNQYICCSISNRYGLFTYIIFYLHYPHPIREVLQLLRKSITVVVRFLITLISTNLYFLAIALSISGTGSILNLSTVNINCNFLVLRRRTPARNICIDNKVESCKVNCNLGSTSDS